MKKNVESKLPREAMPGQWLKLRMFEAGGESFPQFVDIVGQPVHPRPGTIVDVCGLSPKVQRTLGINEDVVEAVLLLRKGDGVLRNRCAIRVNGHVQKNIPVRQLIGSRIDIVVKKVPFPNTAPAMLLVD